MEANIFRPVTLYPPSTRRARTPNGRSPISDVVPGSEKLPPMSFLSRTTKSARYCFVSGVTSGLSSKGITTEACMLKANAVAGQPWPSAS